jgi:hypothetical protein
MKTGMRIQERRFTMSPRRGAANVLLAVMLVVLVAATAGGRSLADDPPAPAGTPSASAPPVLVEVELLSGESKQGELQSLDPASLGLKIGADLVSIPTADLLSVSIPAVDANAPATTPLLVGLVDGGLLEATSVTVGETGANLESPLVGSLKLPVTSLAWVRFMSPTAGQNDLWNSLLRREARRDVVVMPQGDVLDNVSAVVSEVSPQQVKFLLDGDEVTVNTGKVFGIVFARRPPAAAQKSGLLLRMANSQRMRLRSVAQTDGHLEGTSSSGAAIRIPLAAVAGLDFSGGRVAYLSDLEPRDVVYASLLDTTWEYQKNRTYEGRPLQLQGRTYSRGLWIHSKTELKYRLSGEYSRFQAIVGIDDSTEGRGHVLLSITADGKSLFSKPIRGGDAPIPLNLDVTGVRELQILVDFGEAGEAFDDLDLAEARLVK